MAGTVGSNYGIVHDDLPLKSNFKSPHSSKKHKDLRGAFRRKKSARNKRKSAYGCKADKNSLNFFKPRVFISYARKNRKRVRRVEKELSAAGIEKWVDYMDIPPGGNMPAGISAGLKWCNTLLLFWSKAANQSGWVKREWTCAVTQNKRIIPCLLDGTQVPAILACEAFVDFRNFNQGLVQLLHALGR